MAQSGCSLWDSISKCWVGRQLVRRHYVFLNLSACSGLKNSAFITKSSVSNEPELYFVFMVALNYPDYHNRIGIARSIGHPRKTSVNK